MIDTGGDRRNCETMNDDTLFVVLYVNFKSQKFVSLFYIGVMHGYVGMCLPSIYSPPDPGVIAQVVHVCII